MTFLLAMLLALAGALRAQVKITPGDDRIRIEIDGKPFTDFYIRGPEVTKPYLHPLRAASGTYITRLWPMENIGGEPTDHLHQRGMWISHAKVNGIDFWGNEVSYKTANRGRITPKKLGAVKNGKDGSLDITFDWTDWSGGRVLLTEHRIMTFHSDPKLRVIDFDVTLTAREKVAFQEEKDGFLAIRVRPELQEEHGSGKLVNADGQETEKAIWGKPSNWADYAGDVKGEKLGVAILDHPKNPRHPPRWHARGYGLFAVNPFGLSAFTGDKSQDGTLVVEPGKSVRFRYRVIIHPGDAKTADIAGAYATYSAR